MQRPRCTGSGRRFGSGRPNRPVSLQRSANWPWRTSTRTELRRRISDQTGDIFETIRDLATRYQQVIIDAGGRDSEELRSAMVTAQKLYTPLKASQPDLETATNINQLVKLACGLNPNLKAYAIISMAPTHPAITEAQEAHELLMELPEIELSRVFIRERKVFRDAMVEGKGVVECKNRKAKAEIQLLAREIYDG